MTQIQSYDERGQSHRFHNLWLNINRQQNNQINTKNQTPETHLKVQASQNIYVKTEQTSTLKAHGINNG